MTESCYVIAGTIVTGCIGGYSDPYIRVPGAEAIVLVSLVVLSVVLFLISPYTFIFRPSSYDQPAVRRGWSETSSQMKTSDRVCTTNRVAPHIDSRYVYLLVHNDKNSLHKCNLVLYHASDNPTIDFPVGFF